MSDNPPRDTTQNTPVTITVTGNGGIGSADDLNAALAAALSESSRLRERAERWERIAQERFVSLRLAIRERDSYHDQRDAARAESVRLREQLEAVRRLAERRVATLGPGQSSYIDARTILDLVHDCDSGGFDRTICPAPCGLMHSYCTTCGRRADTCAHEPLLAPPAASSGVPERTAD